MGLLDDAIREHLDLKRRHGADPEEIERAEREALGPVRRGPEEAEASASQDLEPAAEEPGAYDHPDEADWEEPFADEDYERGTEAASEALPGEEPLFEEPPVAAEQRPVDQQTRIPEEPPGAAGEPEAPAEEAEAAAPPPGPATPAPEHPEPPEHPHEQPSDETVEYDVEGALGEEGGHRDDVLEETPEFLQDTPDHDRLWFEQRPPRDFDFNE